jgi:hypothetical protein
MSSVPAMLALWDVEQLIDRLPAEQRARFRWAPERFRQILDRLLDGEVTPEVIHQATTEFARVCIPLVSDLPALQPALPEGLSEARSDLNPSREDKLMTYFQGLPAAAGIEWTLGVLRKLGENPLSHVSPQEEAVYEGSTDAKHIQHPSLGLFRAQVILFALLRAIERGIPPERLEDLAETAYLEAGQMVDWMALQGIDLNPLSNLTPEERFAKVLQYIDDVREVMTPEAIDVISRARVISPIF